MRLTALEEKVAELISPVLKDMGLNLLWVSYKGGILGVFAENSATGKLTLEECTNISREISPLLEVEDLINGAYRLEVSSAGIDRPLFNRADYDRYHDLEAKVEMDMLIDGKKKFRGVIRKTTDDVVELETDEGTVDLPFASVYKAKLIMNDELIKETKKRFETANNNDAVEIDVNQTTTVN